MLSYLVHTPVANFGWVNFCSPSVFLKKAVLILEIIKQEITATVLKK